MRGTSWCCTLAANSQFEPRLLQPVRRFGSHGVPVVGRPKFELESAPQMSPPVTVCAAGFVRSQSGTKLPLRSVHARVAVCVTPPVAGPDPAASASTYLLMLTFTAVLPLPNKSYTLESFGVMSFQSSSDVAGTITLRVGVSGVGPRLRG